MTTVAIIKQEGYNLRNLKVSLNKILSDSGILELIKNKKVLIKPNCTGLFRPKEGRTTHPAIIKSLIELLKPVCKSIVIGESSSVGIDTMKAYKATGISDVARKLKIPLIDFKKSKYIEIKVNNGIILKKLSIPEELLEADYIISLAKMKTNYVSHISCSMKNMKGILKDEEKKMFHKIGLSKSIADLNNCFNNVLAVVDGVLASELYEPVKGNVLVASKDAVACDSVCAKIMGINPEKIGYIKLIKKTKKFKKIRLIGDKILQVSKKFKTTPPNLKTLEKEYKIRIIDGKPCSNCIGALYLCLKKTKQQAPWLLKNLKILIGNSKKDAKDCIRFGNCASRHNNKIIIYGCTPISSDFIKQLKIYRRKLV